MHGKEGGRWGQIHYNNPRGCHGPHHSVAADRGWRWTEQEKLSEKKTPEDSPLSEMCFCLHSNTQTVAATRGTRSNKAEREGSREGVVTLTLSTKGEKKCREKKYMSVSKESADKKNLQGYKCKWSTDTCTVVFSHGGNCFLFTMHWSMDLKIFCSSQILNMLHAFASCGCQSHTMSSVKEGREIQPLSGRVNSLYDSSDIDLRDTQYGQ